MANAPKAPSPASPAPAPVTHILVQSKKEGFRRGGRAWPSAWVPAALTEFAAEQLEAIEKEPMLITRRCSAAEAGEVAAPQAAQLSPIEKLQAENRTLAGELAQLKEQVASLVETIQRGKVPPGI